MLELKKITKVYITESFKQEALSSVSVNFRENEFACILGPSGSGKTTLLNIIGGLDHYTSGDLKINEMSTKDFKDSSWDSYRNHRVGFVFQSYNLITHQSILTNVELALTLSGVHKKERTKKAIEALEKVGLKDHMNKKPNELSGGQMQRVAIARALVNDPEILLADEPTGALDSATSIQVLNILKEVAKNKLVIMVTHNEELAKDYSSRIITLKDGKIVSDSNPYDGKENTKEDNEIKEKKSKKTSMSFLTALSLSLNNLLTKKGRTILTAFAGSIGIIGIALILSLSTGVNNYINRVQEDTLTSYPLTIEKTFIDTTSVLTSLSKSNKLEHENDAIYSNDVMIDMLENYSSSTKTNNLLDFKKYIEDNKEIDKYINDIKYGYDLDLQIYSNEGLLLNPSDLLIKLGMSSYETSYYGNSMQTFIELTDNKELLNNQYEIVSGKMPQSKEEVVLIVDKNNELLDYVLYSIGLRDQKELVTNMQNMMMGKEVLKVDPVIYKYDDIIGKTYKLLINTDYYEKENNIWVDKSNDYTYLTSLLNNALSLNIVGIIKPSEDSSSTTMGGIGYTSDLTTYVSNEINNSNIVKEQKNNSNINVFTNNVFTGDATYENNLSAFGVVDKNNPSSINIYPKDFESKEKVIDIINEYNKDKDESNVIQYTDYVGVLMSSVTTIVDVIGYVLIAFVSISLVVSSIMIGIITYISVLERTKEIGILRAIGASKKDISRVFNAETFIIGLTSGLIGIGVTCLLNIIITLVITNLTSVSVSATLPLLSGVALVLISMFLTMISGLIPAKLASKKDPVVALRSE